MTVAALRLSPVGSLSTVTLLPLEEGPSTCVLPEALMAPLSAELPPGQELAGRPLLPAGSLPAQDMEALHIAMGVTARVLWDIQRDRVAANNRCKSALETYPGTGTLGVAAIAVSLQTMEHGLELQLTRLVRKHPMRAWLDCTPGIGYVSFARIIALTGSLDRFPNPAKLWKYLGLHVQDGHAPRRQKGLAWTHTNCQGLHFPSCPDDCRKDHHPNCRPGEIGTAYSPQGRVVCHQIGESIGKLRRGNGPYRLAYDSKKAYYEEARDWTQAHRHQAAMRYAVKCLIRDLWVEWRRARLDAHLSSAPSTPTDLRQEHERRLGRTRQEKGPEV